MTNAPYSTRARPAPKGGGFGGEANPLLVRELRQSLRVPRLPWTIAGAVALIGLGMLSIGSLNGNARAADLGVRIFQGFVSILFLYVALAGPATAAGAIATEREGRTLEPLLLTSLSPRDIAFGKFLASYGTLGVQVLSLLPLAAIPLLFGGVTASELLVCFVYVAIVAAVAISFGLVIASRTQTLRSALAVAIIIPAAGAPLLFAAIMFFGDIARGRWPFLSTSSPIWWSTAYNAVPFGLDYVVFLLVWPLLLLALPLWLFGTLTAANLSGPNDDRSTGYKRWFVGATALVSLAIFVTAFRVGSDQAAYVAVGGELMIAMLAFFTLLLVIGDPLMPSRRVKATWERQSTGVFGRAVGPGLLRGAILVVVFAAVGLGVCFLGGVLASGTGGLRNVLGVASSQSPRVSVAPALAVVAAYVLFFSVFLAGLGAFVRTRVSGDGTNVARGWTIAVAAAITLLPALVATILRALLDHPENAPLFAAPSPLFAIHAFSEVIGGRSDPFGVTVAALGASVAWGALGFVLLGLAGERARKSVVQVERTVEATVKKLEEEDDAEADDDELPPPPPPPKANAPAGEEGA